MKKITGKWEARQVDFQATDDRWYLWYTIEPGREIMNFLPDGTLEETIDGRMHATKYYFTDDGRLGIDRSDPDLLAWEDDYYLIERLNLDEVWLYHAEDGARTPSACVVRTKLREIIR